MNQSVDKYLDTHAPDKKQCTHEMYNNDNYEFNGKRLKSTVWRGLRIEFCETCGKDVSNFNFVPVKTKNEYMRRLDYGQA